VHLDASAGAALAAWLAEGSSHSAAIGATQIVVVDQIEELAWFSGRGPNAEAPAILKPDLVAPGLNILAATTADAQGDSGFALLSGTSMAAPQAVGAATLLRQLHPTWTPSELYAALVTTALPLGQQPDGTPITPHAQGGGRLRVDAAARAGLLLDASAEQFRAAHPALGGSPSSLNLPTISGEACLERCVFTRTVRSALPVTAFWNATGEGDPRLTLAVEPAAFSLAPGASQTLTVTAQVAASDALIRSFVFGAVRLSERAGLAPEARLPVALDAPDALLPQTIDLRTPTASDSFVLDDLRTRSTDSLTLRVLGPTRGIATTLTLAQDPTPLDPLDGPEGVISRTLTVPAGTPRVYVAVSAHPSADVDLFVFADGVGGAPDGRAESGELICVSASFASEELCDLRIASSETLQLIVLVQSYKASGTQGDRVGLREIVVRPADSGLLAAHGPARVHAERGFGIELGWRLPDERAAAGRYIGVLEISSTANPADAGDLGMVPLDLVYLRERSYIVATRR
jgi:hypothetical protein